MPCSGPLARPPGVDSAEIERTVNVNVVIRRNREEAERAWSAWLDAGMPQEGEEDLAAGGSLDDVAGVLAAYRDVGFEHPILVLGPRSILETIGRLAELGAPRRRLTRPGRRRAGSGDRGGGALEARAADGGSGGDVGRQALRIVAAAARPAVTQSGRPTPRYEAPVVTIAGQVATATSMAATRRRCPTV